MAYADAIKLSHKQPVLVMFTASWCGPCKNMKPIVQALAQTQGFPLEQLDADDNRDLLQVLRIRNVPTLMVLSKGSVVYQKSGAQTQAQLMAVVAEYGLVAK